MGMDTKVKHWERTHLCQGPKDENSLLHGGFEYLEQSGLHRVPLVPNDRGRRHLSMEGSATEEFQPCRRVLTPGFSGSQNPRVQGLRRIEWPLPPTPRPEGLRVIPGAATRSGYHVPDPGLQIQSKHTVIDTSTGHPARDHVAEELTLENAFGLKRKLASTREKRAGVPALANPGDKLYHHVEYSPGYHKAGGTIVGSTFCRSAPRHGDHGDRGPHTGESDHCAYRGRSGGVRGKSFVSNGPLGYSLAYRKPAMGYQEKREALAYADELRGVLELTKAPPQQPAGGSRGGGEQGSTLSWEERTGMYTWPKKEEQSEESGASIAVQGGENGDGASGWGGEGG